MANLAYYNLAEAFLKFKRVAEKEGFYLDEIRRMDESIKEMNPVPDTSPEEIIKDMKGGVTS